MALLVKLMQEFPSRDQILSKRANVFKSQSLISSYSKTNDKTSIFRPGNAPDRGNIRGFLFVFYSCFLVSRGDNHGMIKIKKMY